MILKYLRAAKNSELLKSEPRHLFLKRLLHQSFEIFKYVQKDVHLKTCRKASKLTPVSKMNKKLSILISYKIAERSEAKSAKSNPPFNYFFRTDVSFLIIFFFIQSL